MCVLCVYYVVCSSEFSSEFSFYNASYCSCLGILFCLLVFLSCSCLLFLCLFVICLLFVVCLLFFCCLLFVVCCLFVVLFIVLIFLLHANYIYTCEHYPLRQTLKHWTSPISLVCTIISTLQCSAAMPSLLLCFFLLHLMSTSACLVPHLHQGILCPHCSKRNNLSIWPCFGDYAPFYIQAKIDHKQPPPKQRVDFKCKHCNKWAHVIWDLDPGYLTTVKQSTYGCTKRLTDGRRWCTWNWGSEKKLHKAVNERNLTKITNLLANGYLPNIKHTSGLTPLIEACMVDRSTHPLYPTTVDDKDTLAPRAELVRVLCEGGADPNVTSEYLNTPLHVCSYHNDPLAVLFLLLFGVDPTKRNANDKTALDQVVSLLENKKFDPSMHSNLLAIKSLLENPTRTDLIQTLLHTRWQDLKNWRMLASCRVPERFLELKTGLCSHTLIEYFSHLSHACGAHWIPYLIESMLYSEPNHRYCFRFCLENLFTHTENSLAVPHIRFGFQPTATFPFFLVSSDPEDGFTVWHPPFLSPSLNMYAHGIKHRLAELKSGVTFTLEERGELRNLARIAMFLPLMKKHRFLISIWNSVLMHWCLRPVGYLLLGLNCPMNDIADLEHQLRKDWKEMDKLLERYPLGKYQLEYHPFLDIVGGSVALFYRYLRPSDANGLGVSWKADTTRTELIFDGLLRGLGLKRSIPPFFWVSSVWMGFSSYEIFFAHTLRTLPDDDLSLVINMTFHYLMTRQFLLRLHESHLFVAMLLACWDVDIPELDLQRKDLTGWYLETFSSDQPLVVDVNPTSLSQELLIFRMGNWWRPHSGHVYFDRVIASSGLEDLIIQSTQMSTQTSAQTSAQKEEL